MIERGVKIFWLISNVVLATAFTVAWFRGDISTCFPAYNPVQLHFITAIPATLFHFFAALGVIFYFVGTGVWIKDQAMGLAKTDRKRAEKLYAVYKKANRLKGRAFPFATFAIFLGIITFVFGGARQVEAIPLWFHPAAGTLLLLVSLVSFPFIYPAIDQNVLFLDEASRLLDEPA